VRLLRQTLHLLALLLGHHRARPRDAGLVGIGFVIAAASLSVMLAIPAGVERISANTGQPDIAVILSKGTPYEASSNLSPEQAAIIAQLPQVARSASGRSLAAPQFLANTKLRRADGHATTVMLRGVSADLWPLLDRSDSPLQEGARQMLASQVLREQFAVLRQDQLRVQGRDWQIAGFLETGGNLLESELWADLSALQAAYNRPSALSTMWVKLTSADAINDFNRAIGDDKRLDGLYAIDQVSYFHKRVGNIAQFTRAMAKGVSLLLGLAACLVISGMLGIVLHHRRQQMASLRTLGFERRAIAVASLVDVLLLGSCAALVTVGLAWCWLDGVSFGAANFEQAVYARFVIDAGVVLKVLGASLLIGLISAALPLRRALRQRMLSALQE